MEQHYIYSSWDNPATTESRTVWYNLWIGRVEASVIIGSAVPTWRGPQIENEADPRK